VNGFVQDLKRAWRTCLATPGLTLSVALLLALGIGANTAIFRVVDAVLWRPLPFADQDRLVTLGETSLKSGGGAAPVANVSRALWTERLGSDPAAVGRPIVLDGEPYTVVGVMPAGFDFPGSGTRV